MKEQDPQLTMLIELILPKEIFKYFDVINIVDHSSQVDIYLDEKNNPPEEYIHDKLTSKGFSPEITIQDFPLRNKSLYLHIRRRKWINETSGKIITRNWNSVAKGTRMTNEFASFFKKDYLDSYPISSNSLEKFYSINGKHFGEQYKHHLSDYSKWEQKDHADQWLLFPSNCGEYLGIDETSLSNGELYTILTNKEAKGKKGSIVAIIEGTQADPIIKIIKQLPLELRRKVKEVTLDMAGAMGNIVDSCFPRASKVIDRFHVQKLAYDALQQIRIKHRWSAIDKENAAIKFAKEKGEKYKPELLSNGDTLKQLLARSRYLLFKSRDKWKEKQNERATLLFELYPDIEKAYNLTHKLRMIFSQTEVKEVAYTKLARWFNEVDISGFTTFSKISNTIQNHYAEILNFFDNRSTNASAESFNAKLKAFRATQRGVVDIPFFLYRLTKIYA